jgi:hypothetical protein
MGAYLDKPITDKQSQHGAGNQIVFASSSMQGYRPEMEVCGRRWLFLAFFVFCLFVHLVRLPIAILRELCELPLFNLTVVGRIALTLCALQDAHCCEISVPKIPTFSVFGVFDGHGGATVAQERCAKRKNYRTSCV